MSVYEQSLTLAEELEDIEIELGSGKTLNMIWDLKTTPRTGNAVRIKKYNLGIGVQSHFDHEIITAYYADLFMEILGLNFDNQLLSDLCVFHDMSETIVGDVPQFTSRALAGSLYRTPKEKLRYERAASVLLIEGLPEKYVERYKQVHNLMFSDESSNSNLMKFFKMIDKFEPILSVWRYIYFNKELIEIESFLYAMSDFFTNPNVRPYSICSEMTTLVDFFQDKDNARKYYLEDFSTFEKDIPLGFRPHFRRIIESVPIIYVEESGLSILN